MSETERIDFRIPKRLLEQLDASLKGHFNTRTDALLYAIRKLVEELKEASKCS